MALDSATTPSKRSVCLVGGGMITKLQVLPSLYQMQRLGLIGEISVCARRGTTIKELLEDDSLTEAFPNQSFAAFPNPEAGTKVNEKLHEEVFASLPEQSIVYVAIPDQNHYEVIISALDHGHHVVCVKPLVLQFEHAAEIEKKAAERGLFVGVEYHKRYDDRAHIARRKYRSGQMGEFMLGQALLHEKWWYRDSNFMNWCTTDQTDFFVYIGCHYVDLVAFITGLKPVGVSVYGIEDEFPNGNVGYLYTDARVIWDNGACLNVQNGIAYPNAAAGGNDQGMKLYTKDHEKQEGGFIFHVDNDRGASYSTTTLGEGPGDTYHHFVNPDYFQMIANDGSGLRPVGYGYRSIEQLVQTATQVAEAGDLAQRRSLLSEIDRQGIHATPANSFYNELVVEAGRHSICNKGIMVDIEYGDQPRVVV